MLTSLPPLEPPPTAEERAAAINELTRQLGPAPLAAANLESMIEEKICRHRIRQSHCTGGRYREYLETFALEERLPVLLDYLAPNLIHGNPSKFAVLLRDQWAGFENIPAHAQRLADLFAAMTAYQRLLFSRRSWERFQNLPERFTIYRRQGESSARSLCWTASKTRAGYGTGGSFRSTQRTPHQYEIVRTRRIRKSQVMFVCLDRQEEEIVLKQPL